MKLIQNKSDTIIQINCVLNYMLSEIISHYLFNENTDSFPTINIQVCNDMGVSK